MRENQKSGAAARSTGMHELGRDRGAVDGSVPRSLGISE
jgi:hypothetical protein